MFRNLLTSAIANAEHNASMDIDMLYISSIYVNEGPTVKRFRARAKGRGNTILKRTSHISVKVSDAIDKRSSI
jgi:large subunit ribosomal protein L22